MYLMKDKQPDPRKVIENISYLTDHNLLFTTAA
jgi:hypothetical protein